MAPTLSALVKFYRANSMRQHWRRAETVSDTAGAKTLYDFEIKPDDLMGAYGRLMPALAQKVASSFKLAMAGIVPGQPSGVASLTFPVVGVSTRPFSAQASTSTVVAASTGTLQPPQISTMTPAAVEISTQAYQPPQPSSTAVVGISTQPFAPPPAAVDTSTRTDQPPQTSTAPAVIPSTTTAP